MPGGLMKTSRHIDITKITNIIIIITITKTTTTIIIIVIIITIPMTTPTPACSQVKTPDDYPSRHSEPMKQVKSRRIIQCVTNNGITKCFTRATRETTR